MTLDQVDLGTTTGGDFLEALFVGANPLAVSWDSCKPEVSYTIRQQPVTTRGGGNVHKCQDLRAVADVGTILPIDVTPVPLCSFPTSAVPHHVLCVHIVAVGTIHRGTQEHRESNNLAELFVSAMFDAFASQDQHLNGRNGVREVCMCATGIIVVLENLYCCVYHPCLPRWCRNVVAVLSCPGSNRHRSRRTMPSVVCCIICWHVRACVLPLRCVKMTRE